MENENSGVPEETEKGSKKMYKGTAVMMIVLMVLLGGYYLIKVIPRPAGKVNITKNTGDSAGIMKQNEVPVADLDSILDVNYLMGKFTPSKEISFALVDLKYGSREGLYVREEVYAAFINMYNAALKDGVKLMIISAARSFDYQKGIWEAKWSGKRLVNGKNLALTISDPAVRAQTILTYSSMPGTSRHHWGTDIDLNSMDPKYFSTDAGKKIYDWLSEHAPEYGFCQPYCAIGSGRTTGYEEEKWHWSYLPVSKQCLEAYNKKVTYADIKGFSGAETAEQLRVIEDYVMGISTACQK